MDKDNIPSVCNNNKAREEILGKALRQIDLLDNTGREKSKLIKKLLSNEKEILGLIESPFDSDTDYEDECVNVENKVRNLVETEKESIFNCEVMDFEGEIGVTKRRDNEVSTKKVVFPVMLKRKKEQLFSLLKTEKKNSIVELKLKSCVSKMLTYGSPPPLNSPSIIMKAIKDSIIRRKWDNLIQLLLLLIQFPTNKYKPFIRYVCQIIEKYHPVIQQNDLQNQFGIITVTGIGKRIGNAKFIDSCQSSN